jgi:hypothetical protein
VPSGLRGELELGFVLGLVGPLPFSERLLCGLSLAYSAVRTSAELIAGFEAVGDGFEVSEQEGMAHRKSKEYRDCLESGAEA